jgi:hypothetical protein
MQKIEESQPWRTLDYWTDKLNKNPTLTAGDAVLFRATLRKFKDDPRAKTLDDTVSSFLNSVPGANKLYEEFSKKEEELDNFLESSEQIKNLLPYAKNLFDEQQVFLFAHGDRSPQNYLEMLDVMGKAMNDEKLNPEQRIQHANNVLKLIKIHEDKIGKPLNTTTIHLQITLRQIENYLKTLNKINTEGQQQEFFKESDITNFIRLADEWLKVAAKLYQSRLIQVNYIHKHEIWNKDLPNKIIEMQGGLGFTVPISYFDDKIKDAAEYKSALGQDDINYNKLMAINEQLFGKEQTKGQNLKIQSALNKNKNLFIFYLVSIILIVLVLWFTFATVNFVQQDSAAMTIGYDIGQLILPAIFAYIAYRLIKSAHKRLMVKK